MTVSIHFYISQSLAEPLRRQLYKAPVSKHLLATIIVAWFCNCIWDGSPGGAVSAWSFLQSLLHILSLYLPPWVFCSSFKEGPKYPCFALPSYWASVDLWILSWVFQASGLISTYQWVYIMWVLLWLGSLTQDVILQIHHLPKNFINLFLIAEWYSIV